MLGLYGRKEFKYIMNTKERGVFARAYNVYTKRPGFFTPYGCSKDFCGELIAPVVYPIMNTLLCIGSVFVTAGAIIGNIISLVVTGGAFLFCAPEMIDQCLVLTKKSLTLFAAGLSLIAITGLSAAVSLPHSLLSLVTRSIATLFPQCSETPLDDWEKFDDWEPPSDALY